MPITEFKSAYQRFQQALEYIITNEPKLKADSARWEKITKNFRERFEAPLDFAWLALSKEERKRFATLYLARKVQSDETVQKVIKVFNAKVRSVKEDENTTN